MKRKVPDENSRMWLAAGCQPALGAWFAVWLLTRPESAPARCPTGAKPRQACAA